MDEAAGVHCPGWWGGRVAGAVRAQQSSKPTIGSLRAGQLPKVWLDAFQQGLREQGYVDGQNIVVEFRFTDGNLDQLPQLRQKSYCD